VLSAFTHAHLVTLVQRTLNVKNVQADKELYKQANIQLLTEQLLIGTSVG
jgi:hypothetical protein